MQPRTTEERNRRVFVVRATDASSTSVEKALTEEILEATPPPATGGFLVDTVGLSGSSLVCRTRAREKKKETPVLQSRSISAEIEISFLFLNGLFLLSHV